MQLRLIESKHLGISEAPPAGYKDIPKTLTKGRCLYCGHIRLSQKVCCLCRDCVCCNSKEEAHNYD